MSEQRFLTGSGFPYCKGCGHSLVAQNTATALEKLNLDPLAVVLVTDIGCHGIIDKSFRTHTVHGLHGRAVALGAGISAGMNDARRKVIVFIGDGGATIGMQHLIGAAHLGFRMTVVIHNNMLYGMTGGQPSDFTPRGFKTPTLPQGVQTAGYDICELIAAAGASYVSRIIGVGDYSDTLAEAFRAKGFSLLEVMEICPSYGVKSNPGMRLASVVEEAGLAVKVFAKGRDKSFETPTNSSSASLINPRLAVEVKYEHCLEKPVSIMLSGSAGEGVQSAAEVFAKAAMTAGLHATKKGSYPVTVGVGFSASEIIVSPRLILYTGSPVPDTLIVTSADGLEYARPTARKMKGGLLLIDQSLETPETGAETVKLPFREKAGGRYCSLYSTFCYLKRSAIFPPEAVKEVLLGDGMSVKANFEALLNFGDRRHNLEIPQKPIPSNLE